MSTITAAATAALLWLPLDQLEANEFALRTVDLEDPNVLNLMDNIAARGVQKPIGVRPSTLGDKKTPKLTSDGRQVYSVKDGLHRYTGAKLAKLEQVPAIVQSADDAQVEMDQIMDNLHVIPTKAYEYGAGLRKVLSRDVTTTKAELANKLNVSEDFIEARLSLGGIHKDGVDDKGRPTSTIGDLIDKGEICLGNAVALATLKPSEEQLSFVGDAREMKTLEFAKKISDRKKALRLAKQKGQEAGAKVEWSPSAHFRKKSDVEAELVSPKELTAILKAKGIEASAEAIKAILQYVLHLDEQSIVAQKAEHEAREKARLEKLEAAKQERDRLKKVAEDAVAAAKSN
jgi:ParB/RepB/Spo0J family partition protein